MENHVVHGRLVVFEGIDGSGKSTQAELLCQKLSAAKADYRRIVFPRYSEPSSALIRMYLGGEFGDSPDSVNAYAASSFFAVDRFASYVQDWREYYKLGGMIITDRYTTSNMLHQGAKIEPSERENFFKWLYDYEFNRIGLPEPDLVFYMNIEVPQAAVRLASRQAKTGESADIHEKDMSYLQSCYQSGKDAAAKFGWYVVESVQGGTLRSEEEISVEIYERLQCLTKKKI